MPPVPATACDAPSTNATADQSNSVIDGNRRGALYINVTVKDPSAAVQRKVEKKIDKSSLPPPIKALAQRSAPRLAGEVATPAAVASQVSRNLALKIPRKLAARGIEADALPVYRQGSYAVVRVTVRRVDVLRFVNSRDAAAPASLTNTTRDEPTGPDAPSLPSAASPATVTVATAFKELWDAVLRGIQATGESRAAVGDVWPKFLTALWVLAFALSGSRIKDWIESTVLPPIVQRGMVRSLQELLDAKLERKRLVAEGVVLNEADQCRYFYSHLAQLDGDMNDGGKGIGVALSQHSLKQISATLRPRAVARQTVSPATRCSPRSFF